MSFVRPTGLFNVPRRGRVATIDLDIADALLDEYRLAAAARNGRCSSPANDEAQSDSDSDANSEASSDRDPDPDYIPPRTKLWSTASTDPENHHILRPRPAASVLGLSPFPDSFSRVHLRSLNFRFFKWNDQPGALVDLRDRIGTMYFGGPVDTLEWQRTVIRAGQDMLEARGLASEPGQAAVDMLSAGIRAEGCRGYRPQNMRGTQADAEHEVARTVLRCSTAVQTIASFQNSVLKKVASRAWTAANDIIETVLQHDSTLHLPFDLPHVSPAEPTAFSRVDFQFRTDGALRREGKSYVSGMSALTSLGHYHANEGEIVLWADDAVINFPVGSTILLPRWMPYSFTSVEWPGYQMVLSQTCEHGLSEFIANGLSGTYVDEKRDKMGSFEEARAGAAHYGTLREYDAWYENDLYDRE
ncbi:hypothetical protein C8R46DRAFT_1233027 [Mycena filopes]|nr:hypothetical protein C8R46DRAFT_1233027 [Mycena filopes]